MNYKIVTVVKGALSSLQIAINQLEGEVNKLMEQGWKPVGGVHLIESSTHWAAQAMIKDLPED